MDKKKLKLSISGNTKKTITNIEQAKSNPRNSVIINNNKNFQKKKFYKSSGPSDKYNKSGPSFGAKRTSPNFFPKKDKDNQPMNVITIIAISISIPGISKFK